MGQDRKDPGQDETALKSQLSNLSKALDAKRQAAEETARTARQAESHGGIGKAMGTGFRVASELAASILVGGFIGWQLDRWSGYDPLFLLTFLVFGIAAGFWNVYRLAAAPTGDKGKPDI